MDVKDKVVVVTGAGSGIGAAMARRFAAEGAEAVIVTDLNAAAADEVAESLGGRGRRCDVSVAAEVAGLVTDVIDQFGHIDLFCSNAGIVTGVELEDPDDLWHRAYDVNVMAHVYAARALIPHLLERGSGYFLNTASAAGLLTSPGDAPYAVTKHGAVAFAEWLAIKYGGRGIGVSVLCPLGVATPLLMDPLAAGSPAAQAVRASGEIVTPEQVADVVVAGLAAENFLILPHPEVSKFWEQKASDPHRWLAGVRRLVSN